MAGLAILLFAVASTGQAPLTNAREVVLRDPIIRLRDVIEVSQLPRRAALAVSDRAIARLDEFAAPMTLGRDALRSLARRAVPSLPMAAVKEGPVTFRLAHIEPIPPAECGEAATHVAAGKVLWASDGRAVRCDTTRRAAAIRFDVGSGRMIATEELEVGDYLGRVRLVSPKSIERDALLTLQAKVGAVVIERAVVALQPAASGKRVFVKSLDGIAFSVPMTSLHAPGEAK
jgi:hypothetical protein